MEFGVHLPVIDFGGQPLGVDDLVKYVEAATGAGFEAVSANDHMVFGAPWLDGLTALAAVASCSGEARLFTTVANPVVRGPVALAKALAALDTISGGRVVAGLGPGSSERDYASVGVAFEERWPRFDEAVVAMRALLQGRSFDGHFYPVDGPLEPASPQPGGPPIWIGSWGSEAGLRRAARLGDGWLASAYNTTPRRFRDAWRRVQQMVDDLGRDPTGFANGLSTMWFHIDDRLADEVLEQRLVPVMKRPAEQLRERLAFGPADVVVSKLAAFRDAGVQQVFVWPVLDEIDQLHRFSAEVLPQLGA